MSVAVETEEGFRHDTPVALFDFPEGFRGWDNHLYDVAPDGRFLFLVPRAGDLTVEAEVTLLQGWTKLVD